MQVGYGRVVPEGFLPVFSVDTPQEAATLIAAACHLGYDGHYYSRELAQEQTIPNLIAFGDKLEKIYLAMKKNREARCGRKRRSARPS